MKERAKTLDKNVKNLNKSEDHSKMKNNIKQKKQSNEQKKKKKLLKNKKNKKENKKLEDESHISLDNDIKKDDLYSLLEINRNANNEEIRNAYRSLVFKYHPDKNKTDPDATSKFINISRAYKILSNKQSRIIYDETGEYDDEEGKDKINIHTSINDFRKKISIKDIANYNNKYKNSKEEEEDLMKFYIQQKGNITNILDTIPYSTNKDIKRYIKIYEKLFKLKKLTRYDEYEKTKNNINLINKNFEEEKEAKEILEKLSKQISERNTVKRNFNDYLLELAKKYESDKIEEINDEINENDFQNIAKGLKKRQNLKKKKK